MRPVDQTTVEALFDCAKDGMTMAEAAAALGLTYNTVHHYARTIGGLAFAPAKRGRKPLGTNISEVGKLYADYAAKGYTVGETADACGKSFGAVNAWARSNPQHPFAVRASAPAGKLAELPEAVRARVLARLSKGQSMVNALIMTLAEYAA
jgi:hypothetical protein